MSDVWTIARVAAWATDDFRARGLESPRLEAEVLLAHALGLPRIQLFLQLERELDRDELGRYRALITRRRAREPVAYLIGEREFYGRSFRVDARVLIPRPDTETLVQVALARTSQRSLYARALDLCTGSGCVAVTIARERPTWRVTATDLSPDALVVARDNAHRLGAHGLALLEGDLYAPVGGRRFELITANPPYIPDIEIDGLDADVRDFEPRLALSGGADGLALCRRVVAGAPLALASGGVLAVEIMAGTSAAVAELFRAAGLEHIAVDRDLAGHDRVVSGVAPLVG
ncbi:MAG: peptide chain release factor N(5)-glutamine methyltransferase [Polyangiaceae bacterium]|nr:peptide chain release factor N(5)-glutamine methyltransferase [Polyangiaceae bacterium]